MKLIINTTTLSGTGVTQVAFSFIQECKSHLHNTYHIFLSPTLSKEIDKTSFPSNFYFYDFKGHPLYGLKGFFIRKKLKNLEKKINPDVVFTVFGPACWTPRSPHITGFANSYYVYPESPFYKVIPWKEKMRIQLMKWAHRFFLKRNGQYFICETQDMSQRLVKFLKINRNNVFTVSNTFNHFFENPNTENLPVLLPKRREGEFRIVSLASLDIHKNLTVINDVVPILEKKLPGNKVKFVLTVDENKFQTQFNTLAKSKIVNLGRIPVKFCPQLYVESDVLFLPSLIESFSANYPEAMKMKKPILTSNYSFATSICGDAASYFDPTNPNDIADKIIELIENKEKYDQLLEKGTIQLKNFGTAKTRASKYLEIFSIIKNKY